MSKQEFADESPSNHPAQPSRTEGARRLYRGFIIVALGINAAFSSGLIAFNMLDTARQADDTLRDRGNVVLQLCGQLFRSHPERNPGELLREASRLADAPLALLSPQGRVLHQTHAEIAGLLDRFFGPQRRARMSSIQVDNALKELSGGWFIHAFGPRYLLLTVATQHPEDLGQFRYVTYGAGVLLLGLMLAFGGLLGTARWVLYNPLQRLIDELTSELASDVEQRRATEQRAVAARLEAETHLAFRNNLLHASDAGIIATDEGGLIRVYNRAAERLLGYPLHEIAGTLTLEELDARTHRQEVSTAPSWGRVATLAEGEELWIDAEGNEHLLAANRSTITDHAGLARGELVTFIDITERKRLEDELHKNELQLLKATKMASLGEMSTGVAHELNQPLNNIGLLCSRILRRATKLPPTEDAQFMIDKLNRVQGQVQRASRIIEQMRAFGHRTDTADLSSFSIEGAIEHVNEMMQPQLEREGIQLSVAVEAELPRVMGHEGQLEQVLINLLVNAKDAINEGASGWERPPRPQIVLDARRVDEGEAERVEIRVSDQGPGMSKKVQARVFEPFFTTKQVGQGTGLGLSISYSLINGFGGTLSVESESGSGTTFSIVLKQAADQR